MGVVKFYQPRVDKEYTLSFATTVGPTSFKITLYVWSFLITTNNGFFFQTGGDSPYRGKWKYMNVGKNLFNLENYDANPTEITVEGGSHVTNNKGFSDRNWIVQRL